MQCLRQCRSTRLQEGFEMVVREPPEWAQKAIAVLTFPAWGPFIGMLMALIWLDHYAFKLKRRLLGPYVDRWQTWFAWHPVSLDGGFGPTVWLEAVQRKGIGSSYNYGIVYESCSATTHRHNANEGRE